MIFLISLILFLTYFMWVYKLNRNGLKNYAYLQNYKGLRLLTLVKCAVSINLNILKRIAISGYIIFILYLIS